MEKEIQQIQVKIEKAKKSDEYTLYIQDAESKKYVFSKYEPKKTALELVKGQIENKEIVWILYGFGLGYITNYLLELIGDEARIIIIEPNEKVLKEQILFMHDEALADRSNVHIFTGTDQVQLKYLLMDVLKPEDLNNIRLTIMPNYLTAYRKYSTEVIRTIKEVIFTLQVNVCTLSFYAKDNFHNICRNYKAYRDSYEIRQHKNKYKDIPAVIVSAGPSLTKNIDYIKDFKGMVFTGGRTVKPVLNQGVTPDFFVSIDAGLPAYTVIGMEKVENIPLVTVPIGQKKVVECHEGPKYFVNSYSEGISDSLYGENLERIDMGSSVANVCVSLAHYMGCNPIVMIGQDLAFTNNLSHAGNIKGAENVEKGMKNYHYIKVPGFYGEEVDTVENFLTMLRWMEEFIKFYPDRKYINATEGGVYIKGAEHKSFKEVVETTTGVEKPLIQHQAKIDLSEDTRDLNETVELIHKVLEEAKETIQKGIKLTKKLKREYEYYLATRTLKIADIVAKLEHEVDQKLLQKRPGSTILEELFYKAYYSININLDYKAPLMENEVQKGVRIAEKSIKLYEALDKAVEEGLQVINQEMEGK